MRIGGLTLNQIELDSLEQRVNVIQRKSRDSLQGLRGPEVAIPHLSSAGTTAMKDDATLIHTGIKDQIPNQTHSLTQLCKTTTL
ncbi:hypothetical protein JOB18_043362 [Solea senegalensis]|uniref:Uncharacterized protein n=1 Tax=Solea senegalensis TaxID=28829 RepID=A0AAV6RNN2_SOLSE|nr:hypothetical protein JOB18_043362 [Solea senegalensis]